MTQKLSRRLEKLEASTTALLDGPWHWSERAEAVRTRTLEAMSAEEQALLAESFNQRSIRFDEFQSLYPDVWRRYNEAFDRAVREVPAPFLMSIADLWGQW